MVSAQNFACRVFALVEGAEQMTPMLVPMASYDGCPGDVR